MPDFQSCAQCEQMNHQAGAMVYNDLVMCVICDECYTTCDGATAGCPSAPAMKGTCDGAAADMTACTAKMTGCQDCSLAGSCKPKLDACQMDQDCVDFATAIQACPQ